MVLGDYVFLFVLELFGFILVVWRLNDLQYSPNWVLLYALICFSLDFFDFITEEIYWIGIIIIETYFVFAPGKSYRDSLLEKDN